MKSVSSGMIFNIQQFSVHDGNGIRTIVFFKGCPLSCKWCSNPESQSRVPQLAYNPGRCLTIEKCTRCLDKCPEKAISSDDSRFIQIDGSRCIRCFTCASNCPSGALHVYGEEKSVKEIIDHVEKDALFYRRSGGGLTLSGGEAMAQPQFAIALLQEARKRRIHTAMETSCLCSWEDLAEACRHLNQIICDIKHMDDEQHMRGTGVSNVLILNNIKKMITQFPDLPVTIRTPVIPDYNDTPEAIQAIVDFLPRGRNVTYELLPYHAYGESKYLFLGMDYPCRDLTFDENCMIPLGQIAESFNAEKFELN